MLLLISANWGFSLESKFQRAMQMEIKKESEKSSAGTNYKPDNNEINEGSKKSLKIALAFFFPRKFLRTWASLLCYHCHSTEHENSIEMKICS